MSSLREAAQQALAYIEQVDYGPYDARPVITALRAALADQRKPLTDDEIDGMWREATIKPALTSEFVRTFARAIEAAHGIGDSND